MRLAVPATAAGDRLDRFLATRLALPRNQMQRWLREGRVLLDGRVPKSSHALLGGETLECDPEVPAERETMVGEPGSLSILFEDEHLAVLDKPAGLVVHPGAGRRSGTLAHHLLARYPEIAGVGGPGRPGIVHRLDRDTTGLIVIARSAVAHTRLAAQFAGREVDKQYLAIAYAGFQSATGVIDAAIGRHPQRRQEMAVRPRGRPARTGYRVLASAAGIALLRLRLETGRTHQIRVHLKHLGHPLVGDPVYGEARWKALPRSQQAVLRDFPRPALHAWRLTLAHPVTAQPLAFEATVPKDLLGLWEIVTGRDWPDTIS
jgi:23S rRNA pseudouridine1911/1915/1917 synthase